MTSEVSYTLVTSKGKESVMTEKLIGKLDSVIIEAETTVELFVESEIGYSLFHGHRIIGPHYLPLRIKPVDKQNHASNYQLEKYYLNEKLNLMVIGTPGKRVKITFRFI